MQGWVRQNPASRDPTVLAAMGGGGHRDRRGQWGGAISHQISMYLTVYIQGAKCRSGRVGMRGAVEERNKCLAKSRTPRFGSNLDPPELSP